MGVNTAVFQRTAPYLPWNGADPLGPVSCGRLNYVKGHQDLIRAVRILRDQGIDAVLEIAGEDDVGGSGYQRTWKPWWRNSIFPAACPCPEQCPKNAYCKDMWGAYIRTGFSPRTTRRRDHGGT